MERIIEDYSRFHPKLATWLDETSHEVMQVYNLPQEHRKRMRTNNSFERFMEEIKNAPGKQEALTAFEQFGKVFGEKYPKVWKCLKKDKEVLLNFFDYPAKHWKHIRTINLIESTFATVRHRTRQTKECGSRKATRTMVYKLTREAEDHWRRINGYDQIDKVISGVEFKYGEVVNEDQ